MSKPSRKTPPPPAAPPKPARGKTPLLIGAVAVLAIVGIAFFVAQSNPGDSSVPLQANAAPAAAAATTGAEAAPRPNDVLKPHPQQDFPPLQLPRYPLGRSADVITAAYKFAAEHPEILSYVPCFCGCERSGHRGNEDCFVKARAANGDVSEWEEHGMECNVCIDVAQQAMQMHASGASVREIRAAVESKWAGKMPSHTPTQHPPQ
jgi:hypothetical protein